MRRDSLCSNAASAVRQEEKQRIREAEIEKSERKARDIAAQSGSQILFIW